ncbi:hypothetical protein [Aeoliella sp.]|uniref:hypothetical protein n=1 Tax=Aeoliella sp. TaxID=2795800 RepID=UPI003CCC39FD
MTIESRRCLRINGDNEICWTGATANRQWLLYYCRFRPEKNTPIVSPADENGNIAVHEFSQDGVHLTLQLTDLAESLPRRDAYKVIARVIGDFLHGFDGFSMSAIQILEFQTTAPGGTAISLAQKGKERAVLRPREISFDLQRGGQACIDLQL